MRLTSSKANKYSMTLTTGTYVLGRTSTTLYKDAGNTGGALASRVILWPTVSGTDVTGALYITAHAATTLATGTGTVATTPFGQYGVNVAEVYPLFVENPGLEFIEFRAVCTYVSGTMTIREDICG